MMRVTFDTNTLDRAVRPERFPKDPRQTEYVKVHDALARGAIKGFFCDTLVIIEGLQRNDRAAVLASTSLRTEILPQTVDPDGIPAIPINLKVEQRRPSLHPEMAARVSAALGLGLRVLGVPRVGRLRIEDRDGTIYVSEPDTAALSARLDRYFDAATAIEGRGLGIRCAQALAEKFAKRDNATEHWFHSLIRAHDVHEENAVKRACSEWADGDSIAAHVGYSNDFFCTEDAGKSAGGDSILNAINRAWLEQTYGAKFVTLTELATLV
ncbi:MAG: hypothetical protein ACLQIQ_05090 [Beijerinckiaceae bacterium]